MSTEIKIEFQAVSGQTRHFWSKPSPSGQYKANHVDRGKIEFQAFSSQNRYFWLKLSAPDLYGSNLVDQDKN